MIVWNYKELLSEIMDKPVRDKKKINILVRAMSKSAVARAEIEEYAKKFCKNDSEYAIVKKQISNDCKKAKKEKSTIKENVVFSAEEMSNLSKIVDKDAQRVLFGLMIFCKSRGVNYIYLGSKSETKPKDITDATRVPYSAKRFSSLMRELYNSGNILVEPNMKVILPLVQLEKTDGNEIKVSQNSIEWLEVFMGRGIYCQRCGQFVKKQGNNKKYCSKCAEEVKKERDKIRKLKN